MLSKQGYQFKANTSSDPVNVSLKLFILLPSRGALFAVTVVTDALAVECDVVITMQYSSVSTKLVKSHWCFLCLFCPQ